ncbi:unnamed protein product [Sphagnum troendelagicum]
MDRFVVRNSGPDLLQASKQIPSRKGWGLDAYQVDGKLSGVYKHALLRFLSQSYSEIGNFPQTNLGHQFTPPVHAQVWQGSVNHALFNFSEIVGMASGNTYFTSRPIVTCVQFDAQGVYLASVSSNGCLSIHDFEALYCMAGGSQADEAKPIVHIDTRHKLEAIKWNPANQEEVACVASGSHKLYIYDIAKVSSTPQQVLCVKSPRNQNGQPGALFDLCYFRFEQDRVLACGNENKVHLWDRRTGKLPSLSLQAPAGAGDLNSLELSNDEQLVFAGCEGGHVFLWDFRGGRNSAAFVTPGEAYHPPLRSVKLTTCLEDIADLRAQTKIESSSVHSISLNPSCGHQLAFHLNNGWSGALDLMSFAISHIHCPPPIWCLELGSLYTQAPWMTVRRRRSAWLASNSMYAVGCTMDSHINILDFAPGSYSGCSVNRNRFVFYPSCYKLKSSHEEQCQREVRTSEPVVCIGAHPSNDCLVAGTQGGSLLLIAQRRISSDSEDAPIDPAAGILAPNVMLNVSEMLEIRDSGMPSTTSNEW